MKKFSTAGAWHSGDTALSDEWITVSPTVASSFEINDQYGNCIMSINNDGHVSWHQDKKFTEAAEIFIDHIQMSIEAKAEIRQTRKEWEEKIFKSLLYEAKKQPLTEERLTETFRKCIMYQKLKGSALHNNES